MEWSRLPLLAQRRFSMKPPRDRESNNYGAIPKPIDNDRDTEPNLFEVPLVAEATVPRCFLCGRSSWDRDDGFEAGIDYALTQVQGMLQTCLLYTSPSP